MRYSIKKKFNGKNFWRATPLAIIFFVMTSIFPRSIENLDGIYVYEFGMCHFLQIMRKDLLIQKLNLFQVVKDAGDFFVALFSLSASIFICYIFSFIILSFLKHE